MKLGNWVDLRIDDLAVLRATHPRFLVFGSSDSGLVRKLEQSGPESIITARGPELFLVEEVKDNDRPEFKQGLREQTIGSRPSPGDDPHRPSHLSDRPQSRPGLGWRRRWRPGRDWAQGRSHPLERRPRGWISGEIVLLPRVLPLVE